MKTILSLSIFLLLAISFTSCVKHVDVYPSNNNRSLTGTWYVSDASYLGNSGWYSYNADLPGIFSFYNDGTAQYSERNLNLQGSWNTNVITTGYYDGYGNYRLGSHNDFSVSVSGYGNNYVDLYFDNISFAGNDQFTATYYDGKGLERYTFTRY